MPSSETFYLERYDPTSDRWVEVDRIEVPDEPYEAQAAQTASAYLGQQLPYQGYDPSRKENQLRLTDAIGRIIG